MSRYSPIQSRTDHMLPSPESFPPVDARVPQQVDPHIPIEALGIQRTTHQTNALCNLQCPGCYIQKWLKKDGEQRPSGHSRTIPLEIFSKQLEALGPELEEVFLLGAETTMTPGTTREMLEHTAERQLGAMAITNGSAPPEATDGALLGALERGILHKLNISIDSCEPSIHDILRGKDGACEATLETIRRYVEMGYPIKAQITVWPYNYSDVLSTVKTLYEDYGVRGFAFHCGSLEGVSEINRKLLGGHIHPLAWRALVEQLQEFNLDHFEELEHFNLPLIYFTAEELKDYVIGSESHSDNFESHTQALEKGEQKPLPFNACPGIGVPQVYIYATDPTPKGHGRLSACNIDSGAHDRYLADYDDASGKFIVREGSDNQVLGMVLSPNLCPAVHAATGHMHPTSSDRFPTDQGDLYHACRYISNNQMPLKNGQFGQDLYEFWAHRYKQEHHHVAVT